ncbi:hypothetical protein QJS66_15725 [Kocuria rhizophila]|nr:hypothetical protein QJS66_15725 [Kocuria rhizophila]
MARPSFWILPSCCVWFIRRLRGRAGARACSTPRFVWCHGPMSSPRTDLAQTLRRLDGGSSAPTSGSKSSWRLGDAELIVDRVQSGPWHRRPWRGSGSACPTPGSRRGDRRPGHPRGRRGLPSREFARAARTGTTRRQGLPVTYRCGTGRRSSSAPP